MTQKRIDDLHPALAERLSAMERVRDFLAGADSLRRHDMAGHAATRTPTDVRDKRLLGNGNSGGGTWGDPLSAYLPRLSDGQSYSDYCVYVMGALYPNILAKTREDFRGLIFAKAPVIELPAILDPLKDDCDLRGTPLEEALETVVDELYAVSRHGWWIDMPAVPEGTNRAQAETMALRPFIVPYRSENITDWAFDRVDNRIALTRVVLREDAETYRELRLDEYTDEATGSLTHAYRVRLWTKEPGTGEFMPGADETPLMAGRPIPEIPFYFFSPFGGIAEPGKPMLDDLVHVAWSLYRSSALLEHARFTCGLATALALGFPEDQEFVLGGLSVISNTNPEAKFSWAERKGEDCLPLERAVEQKTALLVRMGSKALEESKKAAESAETLRLRSSGDTATCADVAQAVSRIASQALEFCARWLGQAGTAPTVSLSTDYTDNVANPAEISALDRSVTAGNLARSDYTRRLRKVGIIEADRTDEEIELELETEAARRDEEAADALAATAAKLPAEGKDGA